MLADGFAKPDTHADVDTDPSALRNAESVSEFDPGNGCPRKRFPFERD